MNAPLRTWPAGLLMTACTALFAQDGSLDLSFGADGSVSYDIGSGSFDLGEALAIQPDGKVLVAGSTSQPLVDFTVLRLNSDGSLDSGFSTDGMATLDLGYPRSVVVRPDGVIMASGFGFIPDSTMVIAAFQPDGDLDPAFGTNGILRTAAPGHGFCDIAASSLRSDGALLVAGSGSDGATMNMIIACFLANGAPDPSFDGDGFMVIDLGVNEHGRAIALMPDGRIVVAGDADVGTQQMLMVRLNADGSIDTSFDLDGSLLIPGPPDVDIDATELALQPDGKIVAGGVAYLVGLPEIDPILVRVDAGGALDQTFGNGGMYFTGGSALGAVLGMAYLPDSRIVWTAEHEQGNTVVTALVRLENNGEPDLTFGNNGVAVQLDDAVVADDPKALAVQPDGRIILAGSSVVNDAVDFAVSRYMNELEVGVDAEDGSGSELMVYPTPATDRIIVQFPATEDGPMGLSIMDPSGRVVQRIDGVPRPPNGTQCIEVDLAGAGRGVYFIVLEERTGIRTRRFVKH